PSRHLPCTSTAAVRSKSCTTCRTRCSAESFSWVLPSCVCTLSYDDTSELTTLCTAAPTAARAAASALASSSGAALLPTLVVPTAQTNLSGGKRRSDEGACTQMGFSPVGMGPE